MKRIIRMLALLSIGTVAIRASAFREDAAEIQLVRVHRAANQVKIELTLSEGVVPNITRTTGPDRLIMELPQTTTVAGQHSMDVNYGSVERVRVGLHQASPPVARIVVDLNSAGPYTLMVEGNTIALTVLPAGSAVKSEASPRPAAHPWFKVRSSLSNRDASAPDTERSAAARQVTTSALVVTPNLGQKARTSFRIKYVAEGLAYLGGGGNAGLTVGMKLTVWEGEAPEENAKSSVAELRIVSIAANSALAEVGPIARAVKAGDWAFLSLEDSARLQRESSLQDRSRVRSSSVLPSDEKKNSDNRSGHAWDQDRMRGRIALDYSGISSHGSTPGSSGEIGLSFRSDMTNIAGTHWNLQGYWRGRLTQDSQPLEQNHAGLSRPHLHPSTLLRQLRIEVAGGCRAIVFAMGRQPRHRRRRLPRPPYCARRDRWGIRRFHSRSRFLALQSRPTNCGFIHQL